MEILLNYWADVLNPRISAVLHIAYIVYCVLYALCMYKYETVIIIVPFGYYHFQRICFPILPPPKYLNANNWSQIQILENRYIFYLCTYCV